MSDQETMAKMFKTLHSLCELGQYSDSLIFNMDESWISTEKQGKGHVAHTGDISPIASSHCPLSVQDSYCEVMDRVLING